jgi:hypothetical protein
MQTLLASKEVVQFFNSKLGQKIITSQHFKALVHSEACQYLLDHLTYKTASSKDVGNSAWWPGEIIYIIIASIVAIILYLLFGFVTWIPWAILCLVVFPIEWYGNAMDLFPTLPLIICIIYGLFMAIFTEIILIVPWPLLWPSYVWAIGQDNPYQPNVEAMANGQ